jgi:hypothetical protein
MRARATFLAVAAAALGSGLWAWTQQREPAFPHEVHARLFPVCAGCHEGALTGDYAAMFPSPETCASCHDGVREPVVRWERPAPRETNLVFSHPQHAEVSRAAGAPATCQTCHGVDRRRWMAVRVAQAETCLDCHAHAAPAHLAETNPCRTCHVPVSEAPRLATAAIAAFPLPPSHEAPDFLARHGATAAQAQANCAVCHSRESCERCHANASAVPAIAALGGDARVASLVTGRAPTYPVPASHLTPDWTLRHGPPALANIESCANCHTRPGCRSCHIGDGAQQVIAQLPMPVPGGATGALMGMALPAPGDPRPVPATADARRRQQERAQVVRRAELVHPPGFDLRHKAAAGAGQPRCSTCHTDAFCTACHETNSRPGFHPPNFAMRHGAEAYGNRTDCAACHSVQAFCRDCHSETGRTAAGRLDVAFHNAQPLWLLQHAQAARQSLQNCTTCHLQSDCMQCHSPVTGWGVNPHGPGFDPRRMANRNQIMCARCHLGDPLRR